MCISSCRDNKLKGGRVWLGMGGGTGRVKAGEIMANN